MFDVIIRNEQGDIVATQNCKSHTCTIGRLTKNLITLKGWRIAGIHAELYAKKEGVYITDVSGGFGTKIAGQRITTFGPLMPDDVIRIGAYRLTVNDPRHKQIRIAQAEYHEFPEEQNQAEKIMAVEEVPVSPQQAVQAEAIPETPHKPFLPPHPQKTAPTAAQEPMDSRFIWHTRIHEKLMEAMDLRRVDVEKLNEQQLNEVVKDLIDSIITKMESELPAEIDRDRLAKEVLNEAIGLGPLEDFLARDDITEIMVNRYNDIYYESYGKLHRSSVTFSSNDAVRAVIDRIISPLGRRIDESSPMVDGRLKDGSRINAIIPPLSTKGPCLTIRKFSKRKLTSEDLVRFNSVSAEMMRFLEVAILNRKNIIVSGGTGSGKTTFLNVLSNYIPHSERIITVEDSAELRLNQPHTVSLEGRPPNVEGKGLVTIRDLVKNCLRMRPDRIIVGECRGGETLDMLQAMNTGHDGSLTTVHANSPRDLISRLEVMVMMAGMELPERAIREQVASAVDLVVQQARFSDGTRKVTHIAEITGLESEVVQMQNIFAFKQHGVGEEGQVLGEFEATGRVPEFYEDLRQRGLEVDMSIFGSSDS